MTKEIFRAGKEDPLKEVTLKRSPTEEMENDMNKFIEKSLNDFTSPKKSSSAVTSGDPAIVTNRITEDPIVKKIPRIDTTVRKDKCDCDFYYEVRSVTASLSLVGYSSFVCDEDDEPDEKERYLKFSARGPIISCGGVSSRGTLNWEVDPFTRLICFDGEGKNIAGCFDLTSCSKTQKVYSCDSDGDGGSDPCYNGSNGRITESLSDRYTIEDVASNVDKMLGRVDPYGSDGVPKGKRGTVINGSNGSILTWGNQCSSKRAEYISGAGGVSKTILFVEFSTDTEYALTDSNGKTEIRTATVGQHVRVDPPDKKNSWTEIYIFNDSRYICCNTEIGNPKHEGKSYSSTFVPEEGAPPPPIPFIGPDCKKYLTERTVTTVDCTHSLTHNQKYGYGGGPPPDGDGCTYSRDESQKVSILTITTSIENVGGDSTNSTTSSGSSSYDGTYKESCTGLTIGSVSIPPYNYTETTKASSIMSNGNSTTSSTITYNENGSEESVTSSYNGFLGGCSYDQLGEAQCPVISGQSITQSYILNILFLDTTEISQTTEKAKQTTTVTTTYSNEFISQDQIQSGTWEDEDPEDNESLCAMRNESPTSKYRSDVDVTYEVEFDSMNDAGSIAYENWFHYYTIETGESKGGCTKYEVVAHNEKWNSNSSGGAQKFSRQIYLSSPANKHTICAQNVAYISRPLQQVSFD